MKSLDIVLVPKIELKVLGRVLNVDQIVHKVANGHGLAMKSVRLRFFFSADESYFAGKLYWAGSTVHNVIKTQRVRYASRVTRST